MATVTGIFDSEIVANRAVSELLDAGFKKDNISLIISDHTRHIIFSAPTDDESSRATRGGATGALFGGVLGALVAGLTTVGVITVPGSGVLFAGPIVSILTGIGAGATAGGLSGALISAGFAVDEAKRYEEEVKRGKTVVLVHTTKKMSAKARLALGSDTIGSKLVA